MSLCCRFLIFCSRVLLASSYPLFCAPPALSTNKRSRQLETSSRDCESVLLLCMGSIDVGIRSWCIWMLKRFKRCVSQNVSPLCLCVTDDSWRKIHAIKNMFLKTTVCLHIGLGKTNTYEKQSLGNGQKEMTLCFLHLLDT